MDHQMSLRAAGQMQMLGDIANTRPQSETSLVLNELEVNLAELERSLEELGSKLIPVTRKGSGDKVVKTGRPAPATELAGRIYTVVLRLEDLTRRVNEQVELTEL